MSSAGGTLLPALQSLAALVLAQGLLSLIALGLGRRLGWRAIAGGQLLPWLLLAPWLASGAAIAPMGLLPLQLPLQAGAGGDRAHDVQNDVLFQLLPWELEVRRHFAAGRLPLWSDTVDGGSSPWSNPQAQPIAPLALLARLAPVPEHLLVLVALKVLAAFEGTWLLCRALGVRRAFAFAGGVAAALSGTLAAWMLYPVSGTVAWIPWLTLGAITVVRQPSARRIATVAVIEACLLLSGHPEAAFAGGLLAALAALGLRRRRIQLRRSVGAAVLAALLGLGLAACHLAPFGEVARFSQRMSEKGGERLRPYFWSPVPATWFPWGDLQFLRAPLSPFAFGKPYVEPFVGPIGWPVATAGYAGLASLAGVFALAVAGRSTRRRAAPFLVFALLTLLLAASFLPLLITFRRLPLIGLLAFQHILAAGSFAGVIAGTLGVDALARALARRGRAGGAAFRKLAILLVPAALGLWTSPRLHLVALWIALALALALHRRFPRLGAAMLATAVLCELVPWARLHLPTSSPQLVFPNAPFVRAIRAAMEVRPPEPGRAAGEATLANPSLLPAYGIADVRPHNPLADRRLLAVLGAAFGFRPSVEDYFGAFGNVEHRLLDFLNVEVVVSHAALPPKRRLQRMEAGEWGSWRLYRNPDALPRWFLPTAAELVAPAELETWIGQLVDPRRVALSPAESRGLAPLEARRFDPAAVRLLELAPGRVELAVRGSGERLLATSLPSPEGWRVVWRDRTLERCTVNGAFLGVRVPPGARRVALVYRPPGLLAGTTLSLLAALATALLLLRPP